MYTWQTQIWNEHEIAKFCNDRDLTWKEKKIDESIILLEYIYVLNK